MLDFGFSEIILTSAIALVVLGPEKLPKVARQVGTWMGRARAMARQLAEQLEREVEAEDLTKQRRKASGSPPTEVRTPGVSSLPMPFDPSYSPPESSSPPESRAPAEHLTASEPTPLPAEYSAQASSPPHGADWHPSPPDAKLSDG